MTSYELRSTLLSLESLSVYLKYEPDPRRRTGGEGVMEIIGQDANDSGNDTQYNAVCVILKTLK